MDGAVEFMQQLQAEGIEYAIASANPKELNTLLFEHNNL